MKSDPTAFLPVARRKQLITKEADDELLIYDLLRDEAHCLNPSAARIWKLCNGKNTPEQIANVVQGPTSKVQSSRTQDRTVELVWFTLEQLGERHLLEQVEHKPSTPRALPTAGMSRRQAIKRFAIGAGIAVPTILSITAPTAEAATSCKRNNQPCTTGECCSGVCGGTPPKCVGG